MYTAFVGRVRVRVLSSADNSVLRAYYLDVVRVMFLIRDSRIVPSPDLNLYDFIVYSRPLTFYGPGVVVASGERRSVYGPWPRF